MIAFGARPAAPAAVARLLLLLLCLCLLASIPTTAAQRPTVSSCPVECDEEARAWCETTFGRGGYLSVVGCGSGQSFYCMCNNASLVEVRMVLDENSPGAAVCNWTGQVFETVPGGEYCTPTTALCPDSCADIDTSMCESQTQCEEDPVTRRYNFSCTTCAGRVVTIVGDNESCDKRYSNSILCNPLTTCHGHGCCTRPTPDPYPVCTCFRDRTRGFWAQPQCEQCASGYDHNKGCREPTGSTNIVFVLSSIATTWTMLCPNLAVPVLFVILGLARRLWDSDRSFTLTALRRARLTPVQTARRSQQSLFHSKYVPRRPAKSRCFLNEPPENIKAGLLPRGPPAY